MSVPTSAKNADVYIAGVAVGHAKNVRIGVDGTLVKDHDMDSKDPAILELGNLSYPVSAEKLFIDDTHLAQVLAGTPIGFQVKPSGGKMYTFGDCVLNRWELTITDPGPLLSRVSGEGKSITIS